MKFLKAAPELFLKQLAASLPAVLGLIFFFQNAQAATWADVNENLDSCKTFSMDAAALIKGLNVGDCDDRSIQLDVLKLEEVEYKLGVVIDVYQKMANEDLPAARGLSSISSSLKSSFACGAGKARRCLSDVKGLKAVFKRDPRRNRLGAGGGQLSLIINLRSLIRHTAYIQKRLQSHGLR